MTLRALAPAVAARIADSQPAFSWNDDEVQPYRDAPSERLEKRLARASGRASMALTLAIGEWVCQRFSRLNDDPKPMQFLEAGWAEQMSPGHCRYTELDERRWRGDIRGPLAMVIKIANDVLFDLEEDTDTAERALWMMSLAIHVLPSRRTFEAWLKAVVDRTLEFHPRNRSDRESLEGDEFGLGRPVARELFDTTRAFDRANERRLIQRFLRSAQARSAETRNPYLVMNTRVPV